ncbi:major facilitator transporter [Streptomyces viridochromogenes DSM 40736]|uniref:Major facilitator transporter n=1 Tax=Streptomyces viridochromogenes (strain DSM 40736 / JCM 4977 / BCRC 1201 / Tue 494) TaxID=591159 RepID=D9X6S1_STRVT|nr:MFS transporter [Streptomyces viridochromogenes]EFL33988.1 major facilitator transporter [Streptomyces viridochromogenes DSM 40736]
MNMKMYRKVLALPGIGPLMLLGLFSKIAVVAIPVVLNLAVVLGLDRGFGAAGLVITAWTVGVGIGGPLQGRMMDRYGARPVLLASVAAQLLFWGFGPLLPYEGLVAGAVAVGLLNLPGFALVRLRLAVAVPAEDRNAAFALDAMTSNISYMVGPALGVTVATAVSSTASMRGLGVIVSLAGLGLALLDPAVRATTPDSGTDTPAPKPTFRDWFTPALVPVLMATTATTLATAGYETAIVGGLRESGQLGFSGVVLTVCGFCSLIGALVYGTVKRPPGFAVIAGLVGLTTVVGGFATGQWWLLCLAMALPAALCSPAFASTGSAASALAPEGARGVVMGCYSAALTVGNSVGPAVSGAVQDSAGPRWAFVVIGLAGAALSTLALLGTTWLGRRAETAAPPEPDRALADAKA